jgi:hypothetical protein
MASAEFEVADAGRVKAQIRYLVRLSEDQSQAKPTVV